MRLNIICLISMISILVAIIIGFSSFILYLFLNAKRFLIKDKEKIPPASLIENDWSKAFNTFAKSLSFKTISKDVGDLNESQIKELINYLEKAFPHVHSCPWIERRIIDGLSLLYIVDPGKQHGKFLESSQENSKNPSKPWVVIAHLDVVPVDPKDVPSWKYEPFSGNIDPSISESPNDSTQNATDNLALSAPPPGYGRDWTSRFIYGRGALDVKNIVVSTLEALELHLTQNSNFSATGQPPIPPLYLVFGCDEEVGGLHGAKVIAETLARDYNVTDGQKPFSFILDEGTNVYTDLPIKPTSNGEPRSIACISVSEKSTVKIKLTTKLIDDDDGDMGQPHTPVDPDKTQSVYHSSIPPSETALTRLARAVLRVSAQKFPIATHIYTRGSQSTTAENRGKDLLVEIGHQLAPVVTNSFYQFLFANIGIFRNFLTNSILSKNSMLNSCLRTTSCVTIFNSGIKDNVIPNRADASLNQRIHPTQTVEEVMAMNSKAIADPKVKSELVFEGARVPISSVTCPAYNVLTRHIKHIFGSETVVIPIILTASTDSKHFISLTDDIYRFTPVSLKVGDLNRFHGINERISLASYAQCVNFYYTLMGELLFGKNII